MIPAPRLDDRAFEDIVAEAIRLIPRYCPEWTNHNAADPGITLIELAAWMTDIILYRLNIVPEKNYIAFLNLLNIQLKPPQAARAQLTFALAEGAERQTIPEGTQVTTAQAADEETITFETTRDLYVTSSKLDRCFSYWNETYSDNSAFVGGSREAGFEAFGGAERVDRFLYVGDGRFANLGEGAVLRVAFGCPDHGGRDLARILEWEFWNGQRWRGVLPAPLEVERGEVCFRGPAEMKPLTVHNIEDVWLRGRLAEIPTNPQETEVDTIRARIEVLGEGLPADKGFANLDNNAFIALDLGKNIFPFGKEPKPDCCFYLANRELLKSPDAEVRIEVVIADPAVISEPKPADELLLAWEYFDGKRWRLLGKSTGRGTALRSGAPEEHAFRDELNALSRTGQISFRRPKDLMIGEVNGEENYWIRARIELGDYGRPGNYVLDEDKWVWHDDKPLHPPALRQVSFKYREDYRDVRRVVSFNDFRYRDSTDEARTQYTLFQPFSAEIEESPTLYLGFDKKLSNDSLSIHVQLAEHVDDTSEPEQRVIWEYWNGREWSSLAVRDGTHGFCSSGFVDFVGPDDMAATLKFTEERFWIRARLEMGGYVRVPRIRRVINNTVDALNVTTFPGEILGSSDGTPLQEFSLSQAPLLEGEVIEVLEREPPQGAELDELGEGAIRPSAEGEPQGHWVRWKAVDSFFQSGPNSRHYVREYEKGRIRFGNSRRGAIPQEGRNSIVARRYQVGGGARGNVNAHTLTALTRSITYIETVTNHSAAAGGADAETAAEAKERAPYQIKSRDRAVTTEDFEQLALRASSSLARAKCLPDPTHQGLVTLVLVPKADKGADQAKRLTPSQELIRHVKTFLDERRLLGTILNVIKPTYRELSVKVVLLRRTVGTSERLRRDIEERLRRFLHPLTGGRDGKGWPFGRGVLKSDLIHLIEEIPGVDSVDSLVIMDEDSRVSVEQLRLESSGLPHLVGVNIAEKVRDEIV